MNSIYNNKKMMPLFHLSMIS